MISTTLAPANSAFYDLSLSRKAYDWLLSHRQQSLQRAVSLSAHRDWHLSGVIYRHLPAELAGNLTLDASNALGRDHVNVWRSHQQ